MHGPQGMMVYVCMYVCIVFGVCFRAATRKGARSATDVRRLCMYPSIGHPSISHPSIESPLLSFFPCAYGNRRLVGDGEKRGSAAAVLFSLGASMYARLHRSAEADRCY